MIDIPRFHSISQSLDTSITSPLWRGAANADPRNQNRECERPFHV